VQQRLLDLSQPLTKRMRVVCSLRAVKGEGTIEALASCMNDESALLRHEVAYALGQKEEVSAVPVLVNTLRNDCDTMVRHEAAEALGAMQAAEAEAVLKEFENCEVEEVAHTCQLALDRLRWARKKAESQEQSELVAHARRLRVAVVPQSARYIHILVLLSVTAEGAEEGKKFMSIDPAPPADMSLSVDQHVERLLDPKLSLFERYGSLFALRDMGTKKAVLGVSK
jgi:deoxyhypusine monooxygenase